MTEDDVELVRAWIDCIAACAKLGVTIGYGLASLGESGQR